MPAREEISIKKLGIIAGGGVLPYRLQNYCIQNNIECHVVGFTAFTDHVHPDFWGRIGAAGKIIQYFKNNNVRDMVMIGAVKRPGFFDLWPDWITFKFFVKAWVRSFGDSHLLDAARFELEARGFKLHGVHEFLPDVLMGEGVLGAHDRQAYVDDIQIGIKAARELGERDKGQAVIVKDGKVIAREDRRGTSAMIKRHGCAGAVLVKICKPQQDMDMDLPTIGAQTAALCVEKKMAGIAGQAGKTLFVESGDAISRADQGGLFIVGVSIDERP